MRPMRKTGLFLLPLTLAIGLAGGIFIGKVIYDGRLSPSQEKMMEVLSLIRDEYVDDIDTDSLLDENYSHLLSMLDPHSSYIKSEDLTSVNEDLEGSFSGVGVSFQILNDTVNIIEIVAGGPAENVGLMPGDRILMADTVQLTGRNATNENVYKTLRGRKGTEVELTIDRARAEKPLKFKVTRGEVPQTSVDSKYMIADNVGYVKVSKFASTTYDEFRSALLELSAHGAEKFVVDLRGNSGGFMDQAILMANEFLPEDRVIVYTKGKNPLNESFAMSDGHGGYLNNELVVLTDEFSASASEIFAGALQDNDRAMVVGRRSFGKGLVQNQFPLLDESAIRLTVARYYTPSGRSIQKEYRRGDGGSYELDITDRFQHGEFYSADSIKIDKSKVFKTVNGRNVYGGGGIMPDIFVPEDTTGMTSYYIGVMNSGLIQKYAYKVADNYRALLKNARTIEQLEKIIPRDNTLLEGFVAYAAASGVPARWYYIRQSRDLILHNLKAIIVRDVLGYNAFIQMLNRNDRTVDKAVETLEKGVSPINIRPHG